MAHESFEDDKTAALMNDLFIIPPEPRYGMPAFIRKIDIETNINSKPLNAARD